MDKQHNRDHELVERFGAFVETIAARLQRELGVSYEFQDLVAFGYAGLLEAHLRFEPTMGVPFKHFAAKRIRGAMIDGIRRMSYLPRRVHARLKLAEALDAGTSSWPPNPEPDPNPWPASLQAAHTLHRVLGQMAMAYAVATHGDESDHAPERDNPEEELLRKQRRSLLDRAIAALPERERCLIQGHYLEGRSLEEVGQGLGLSRSWASRIHGRALSRLRQLLGSLQEPSCR